LVLYLTNCSAVSGVSLVLLAVLSKKVESNVTAAYSEAR